MAENRIKLTEGTGVYHCMTRTVAGERLFDEVKAKEVLRKMIREVADFSGVEILAYCIMNNHFHVLVRVAEAPQDLSRKEILRRYAVLYSGKQAPGVPGVEVMEAIFARGGPEATEWEARLRARMHDVSEFMKTLKQRFSIWYNRNHNRFGTLWAERFRSVLVENTSFALRTVAAYIDLNAVRAGLTEDPGEYRWCSYADAMGGEEWAQKGIACVVGAPPEMPVGEYLATYRVALFGKGGTARKVGQPKIPESKVRAILDQKGTLEAAECLRLKIPLLCGGKVLGSAEFLESFQGSSQPSPSDSISSPTNTLPEAESPAVPTTRKKSRSGSLLLEEGQLIALRQPRRPRQPKSNASPV